MSDALRLTNRDVTRLGPDVRFTLETPEAQDTPEAPEIPKAQGCQEAPDTDETEGADAPAAKE